MARRSKLGRVDGVPMVAFRVSAEERKTLQAAADADGISVNELARRRTIGVSIAPPAREPREVRVVYDEQDR